MGRTGSGGGTGTLDDDEEEERVNKSKISTSVSTESIVTTFDIDGRAVAMIVILLVPIQEDMPSLHLSLGQNLFCRYHSEAPDHSISMMKQKALQSGIVLSLNPNSFGTSPDNAFILKSLIVLNLLEFVCLCNMPTKQPLIIEHPILIVKV
ncbi:hypothetical protein G4B88_024948 [Cannabis sativa]|uniref:Uncharacterized protein n=1 Tax=Cannabis sativa TaxID=3483 RepID=A0A7J6GBC7_CANSA|nr:hypothetical protein G4B88_024948 [Cannabis sativa]